MKDCIIEIPNDNPFKNDEFEREIIARNFMKIFNEDEEGIILSIDSNWGTGKTTFIKMWESLINNNEDYNNSYEALYFNAWDNDYMSDPLLAILTEIEIDKDRGITKYAKDGIKNVGEVGKNLITTTTNVLIKLGSAGAIEGKDLDFRRDDVEKKYQYLIKNISKEVLENAIDSRKIRESFKKNISKVAESLNKKIIFFIDELDRCRPNFAIELLETIKHLFSMKGVIFVISLDKEQLSHSIGTIYGQGMDSNGYLKRFFDIEYKLPNANRLKYMNIKNKKTLNGYSNTKYLEQFLDGFIKGYNFSLRDIDKLHDYMKILIPLIDEYRKDTYINTRLIIISYLYAYLISIKVKKPDLFNKIMNAEYEYDMSTYDEVLKLDETYKIDFFKENSLKKEVIHVIQNDVIKNFLCLNYLSHTKPREIIRMNENTFTVELDQNEKFNMVYLFDDFGICSINLNMEFMNNLNK